MKKFYNPSWVTFNSINTMVMEGETEFKLVYIKSGINELCDAFGAFDIMKGISKKEGVNITVEVIGYINILDLLAIAHINKDNKIINPLSRISFKGIKGSVGATAEEARVIKKHIRLEKEKLFTLLAEHYDPTADEFKTWNYEDYLMKSSDAVLIHNIFGGEIK